MQSNYPNYIEYSEPDWSLPFDQLPEPTDLDILKLYGFPDKVWDILYNNGFFITNPRCPSCSKPMEYITQVYIDPETLEETQLNRLGEWNCTGSKKKGGKCRTKLSPRHNSFISGTKLKEDQFLILLYYWFIGSSNAQVLEKLPWAINPNRISSWFGYFREVSLLDLVINPPKLGGSDDTIVEVDEICFGRRKHNRGKVKTQYWVLGMIEKTIIEPPFKGVVSKYVTVFIKDRRMETMTSAIRTFVEEVIHYYMLLFSFFIDFVLVSNLGCNNSY